MLAQRHLGYLGLAIVAGLVAADPAFADAKARSDTSYGVQWNTQNQTPPAGDLKKEWQNNPGGSTYVMQVFVQAPAISASIPPAAPFPVGDGVTSDPAAAPQKTKFTENPAGTATAGKAWGTISDATAGNFATASATGASVRRAVPRVGMDPRIVWEASYNPRATARASAVAGVPRATAWAKVFDPWDLHDYAFIGGGSPNPNDVLYETAALSLAPILEVDAPTSLDSAVAVSETRLSIEDVEVFRMILTLSEANNQTLFSADIGFDPLAQLFRYHFDANGEVIIDSLLAPGDFITEINSYFNSGTGLWTAPAGGINVLVAHKLLQPTSFYESGGHVSASYIGSDRVFAQVTPEPGTIVLFGGGLLLAAARRRRRTTG